MENQNNYRTNDLKLFSFLRTVLPDSFMGIDKNSHKVAFIFKDSKKLTQLIDGYWRGEKVFISPLQFAQNFDVGKTLIFGNSV